MRARFLVSLLVLLSAGLVHAETSKPAARAEPATFVAPQDKALVVFVRPSKAGKAIKVYIVDQQHQFLTVLKGKQYATLAFDPGKYTFYVVSENAALVRADLVGGRTYIIETRAQAGLGKARVTMAPALRGTRRFDQSVKWLRNSSPASPDLEGGAKWVRRRESEVNDRIRNAEAEWSLGDEKYRAALTLKPEDGRTAEEAKAL